MIHDPPGDNISASEQDGDLIGRASPGGVLEIGGLMQWGRKSIFESTFHAKNNRRFPIQ